MKVENISVSAVTPYDRNAKRHSADQVDRIAKSLREFGWQQPIVIDKNGVVVIGHGRLLAAKKLGMTEVPCVRADSLSDQQIKALRLADNKVAESEWDKTMLDLDMSDIIDFDMSDFGFELKLDAVDDIEDDEEEDEDDDPRSPAVQHNVFENQERMQFAETNYYGIPQMAATDHFLLLPSIRHRQIHRQKMHFVDYPHPSVCKVLTLPILLMATLWKDLLNVLCHEIIGGV